MDTMTNDRETRPYTPEEVGRLVQMMRDGLGWSQETLAELANLHPCTIQRMEAGEGDRSAAAVGPEGRSDSSVI